LYVCGHVGVKFSNVSNVKLSLVMLSTQTLVMLSRSTFITNNLNA